MENQQKIVADREWIECGQRLAGTEDRETKPLPSWVDSQLIKEGQDFVKRHLFSVIFVHLISLLFLLCYAPIRYVLISTGRSHSPQNSKLRYFSTLMHIKKWYEGELLDPTQSTQKDILKVRRLHYGVVRKLEENNRKCSLPPEDQGNKELRLAVVHDLGSKLSHNNNLEVVLKDGKPRLLISQLDMAVTQFCFAGFLPLFWRELGVPELGGEERGIQGFLHIWATIGHLLGIREDFNVALERNERQRKIIWTHLLLPHFYTCHPGTMQLWVWLVEGLNGIIYFLSLRSLLLFITLRLLKVDKCSSELWKRMNWRDYLLFHLMKWCFSSWLHTPPIRKFLNALLRFAIWFFAFKQRWTLIFRQ